MVPGSEDTKSLLDALYLEMLHLIQQKTATSIHIENLLTDGKLLIAKTRYIQGSQAVSSAQIPTKNSAEFNALHTISQSDSDDQFLPYRFELKDHEINKVEKFEDPLRWFGILAPSSLRDAAKEFRRILDFIIECANLQRQLHSVINDIKRIKTTIFKESS